MDLTARLNQNSIETVRSLIAKKNSRPYFASGSTIKNVVTDMDHHPYDRWFRGVSYFPEPIVMEREAGWRPRHDGCYKLMIPPVEEEEPYHCFEAPCSTTFPCYPEYQSRFEGQRNLNALINNNCIVKNY